MSFFVPGRDLRALGNLWGVLFQNVSVSLFKTSALGMKILTGSSYKELLFFFIIIDNNNIIIILFFLLLFLLSLSLLLLLLLFSLLHLVILKNLET